MAENGGKLPPVSMAEMNCKDQKQSKRKQHHVSLSTSQHPSLVCPAPFS